MTELRIAFAGDRDISVRVLDFILTNGVRPLALLVSDTSEASHAKELIRRCAFLEQRQIMLGSFFLESDGLELLHRLDLDYIIAIHFPYIVPESVLSIPRFGVLNLHPALLPYNRGWHTPIWAILDGTPIGATLHFMDSGIDTGDIVHQRALSISPGDTANSLYQKLKNLEFEVFKEAWPSLLTGRFQRLPQRLEDGTVHQRRDLFTEQVQRIDLDQSSTGHELIRKLRALTTNRLNEAAYYEEGGRLYRIQIVIHEE